MTVGMVLASDFPATVTAARLGDVDAFRRLHRELGSGLHRYVLARGGDAAGVDRVWGGVAKRLSSFAGDEGELRTLLYLLARQATDWSPRGGERGTGNERGERDGTGAALVLSRCLPPEQAEVVLLRVVGDLEVDDVAHVLHSTSGAVRRAQYHALVTLVHLLGTTPASPPPEEVVTSWMNLADHTPDLVFGGALPTWQARGRLAPVARLVAAARRPDEPAAPLAGWVTDAVARLAPLAPTTGTGWRPRPRPRRRGVGLLLAR